ncbi:MAG: oligosaccharide flippase family protein [Bacteroidetes bacterium]|nr:oligosaccharide flippase family protein [Bacteroidota bacterium]
MKRIIHSSNLVNTFWNLLDVMIFPVVFLALTPFFIFKLGAEEFGLWMLINSVLASFHLMNFGLGSATQRNVARFLGRNDTARITQTINTNLSLSLIVASACVMVGFVLKEGVSHFGLFHLDDLVQGKAADLMLMASFLVSLKFIEQIFQHALKGFENFKAAAKLNLSIRFLVLTANVLWVFSGYGLYHMLATQILISLVFLLVHFQVLKRVISQYKLYLYWDRGNILDELRYGLHTWIQSVAVIISYQMDRFIVTSFFGLTALSYYSIVATIFNHIHMSFNALVPWLLPKVARLREQGTNVTALFFSARSFVLIVGIGSLLLFYSLSQALFTLWLGTELYQHIQVYIQLFLVFELFFLFTSAPYFFLNANGNQSLMTKITWTLSLLSLSGMFLGIYFLDSIEGMIYGLIAGTVVGISIENAWINKEVLNQNPAKEGMMLLFPAAFASIIVLSSNPIAVALAFVFLLFSSWYLFVKSGDFKLKVLLFG